jgi:hypothetical protein
MGFSGLTNYLLVSVQTRLKPKQDDKEAKQCFEIGWGDMRNLPMVKNYRYELFANGVDAKL